MRINLVERIFAKARLLALLIMQDKIIVFKQGNCIKQQVQGALDRVITPTSPFQRCFCHLSVCCHGETNTKRIILNPLRVADMNGVYPLKSGEDMVITKIVSWQLPVQVKGLSFSNQPKIALNPSSLGSDCHIPTMAS